MTDLALEILDLSRKNEIEKIETIIEDRLIHEPENVDLWLKLAVLELIPPISDYYKSIDSIKKILAIEKSNVAATLLLAYVNYYYLGGIDEELFCKIKSLITDNDELNSMQKYAESWFYDGKDSKIQEMCLRESISICNRHVWNNYYLAKLCFANDRVAEGKIFINKALENVAQIYLADSNTDDITDVDEFINERIKGIHLTQENFQLIESLLMCQTVTCVSSEVGPC